MNVTLMNGAYGSGYNEILLVLITLINDLFNIANFRKTLLITCNRMFLHSSKNIVLIF